MTQKRSSACLSALSAASRAAVFLLGAVFALHSTSVAQTDGSTPEIVVGNGPQITPSLQNTVRPIDDLTGPLTADIVLAASAEHAPLILEALAKRQSAAGNVLAADGAFDLLFSVDGTDRVSGFWSGGVVNSTLRQRIAPLGASVYGGYRLSDGRFPIYEDENFTNTGGELKIGALFSLLRNRAIDDERFGRRDSRLAFRQADLDVLLTQVGVQHRALIAYWRWVMLGRKLSVYEKLLKIAELRESGLEEQVRSGARAAIFITENRQNINRRRRLATEARRDFLAAANDLAFYYRNAAGAPTAPSADRLPAPNLGEPVLSLGLDEPADISAALAVRPELEILRIGLERAEGRIALGRNDLLPQLDVSTEVSRDLGDIAEGGPSRDSTDTIVGLRFSVPIQQRKARGGLQKAEADRDALRQSRRQLQDQIEIELRNILIDLNVSKQLVLIAEQEVDQSVTMEEAERERFASGASDFFLVNIREETAADARIRYYAAALQTRIARANYDAATVNTGRLGIGE
ncbi:MAG: TolC family protein [Pseudomonadota bacterium]